MKSRSPRRRGGFRNAGIDVIEHDLRFDLFVGKRRSPAETLVFNGRMVIQRGDPYVNRQGKRQIDFTVKSWVAAAFSKVLQQEVVYILSQGIKQRRSTIIAQQEKSDFPATFTFSVIFDVRVGNRTILRRHHGRPKGKNFRVVPPDGNRKNSPTIRTFEKVNISVNHPELGTIRLRPRDCNDRKGKTVVKLA